MDRPYVGSITHLGCSLVYALASAYLALPARSSSAVLVLRPPAWPHGSQYLGYGSPISISPICCSPVLLFHLISSAPCFRNPTTPLHSMLTVCNCHALLYPGPGPLACASQFLVRLSSEYFPHVLPYFSQPTSAICMTTHAEALACHHVLRPSI